MRIYGDNGGLYDGPPVYIKAFDPDTHAPGRPFPTGDVTVTHDARDAKIFASAAEAMQFWGQQSKAVPLRPDGKPNKPLTAFTVQIEPVQADA